MSESKIASWVSQFVDESCSFVAGLGREESKRAASLLHHHLLAPRAYRRLMAAGRQEELDPVDLESLRRSYLASIQRQPQAQLDLDWIRKSLISFGVRPIFLKGIHLAKRFYQHPEDRIFSDIDLYIQPSERAAAEKCFQSLGFIPSDERPKFQANRDKLDLRHSERRELLVDCHFAFGHGRYKLQGAYERAHLTSEGHELQLEDEFVFLLYHALVQHRMEKLAWLSDLMRVRRMPGFSMEVARSRTGACHMEAAFSLAWRWMDRLEGKMGEDSEADYWWEVAVLKQADGKPLQVARMRSLIYGGWTHFLDYAIRHKASGAYFRITSALNSLTDGPQ